MNAVVKSIINYCVQQTDFRGYLIASLSGAPARRKESRKKNAWRVCATEVVRHFRVSYRKNKNTRVSFVSHVADDEISDNVSLLPRMIVSYLIRERKAIMMIKNLFL